MDRRDVRVVERGEGLCLALEPRKPIGVLCEMIGQNLERDLALQLRVARPIHFPHAACPERGDDFVRTEPGARGEGHVREPPRLNLGGRIVLQ